MLYFRYKNQIHIHGAFNAGDGGIGVLENIVGYSIVHYKNHPEWVVSIFLKEFYITVQRFGMNRSISEAPIYVLSNLNNVTVYVEK